MEVIRLAGRPSRHATASMNSSAAEDLLARVRLGDDEAFRLIFERYARPVIGFIFLMVNCRDLAEELAQETFVRAYRAIDSLRDEARLSTWLFGIARNVAREGLRRRLRDVRRSVELDSPKAREARDLAPAPDGRLLDKELNDAIGRALSSLDEDKRLVFTLKVYQQRSYEEIAEITGFSAAKVRNDLHRARVEMRRRLKPFLGERR